MKNAFLLGHFAIIFSLIKDPFNIFIGDDLIFRIDGDRIAEILAFKVDTVDRDAHPFHFFNISLGHGLFLGCLESSYCFIHVIDVTLLDTTLRISHASTDDMKKTVGIHGDNDGSHFTGPKVNANKSGLLSHETPRRY